MIKRHTILIVDDEPNIVASVHDLFRMDYRVLGATSADAALQILERETVHVILTDQRMPGITGVEFLERVQHQHPEATRILITGYADISSVIDAINRGNVYRYIAKPWTTDDLRATLREACQWYDMVLERKEMTEQLRVKNEELMRTDVIKSAFIHVVSHELRTPLTIQVGLTDLATHMSSNEPLTGLVKRAHGAGQRVQHLIEQIVSMLSAEQFEHTLNKQPHDLSRVVTKAADDVHPFIEKRNQSLAVDVPDDLGNVELDEEKIRDCINQLLMNAIKFTADGGKIAVTARICDGMAVISVSDTGVGIASESLPHIFERFFTELDVSHHSSGVFEFGKRGLGLGLSVVKEFVQMHGGTVDVMSTRGVGTTFTLRWPTKA